MKDSPGYCPRNAQSAVVLRFCLSVAALSALVTCISRKELLDGKQCAPAGTGPECAEGYSCYRPRNICLSPSQLALVADDDVSDSPDGGADDDDSESTAGAPGDDDVSVIAGGAVDTSMAGTSNAAGSDGILADDDILLTDDDVLLTDDDGADDDDNLLADDDILLADDDILLVDDDILLADDDTLLVDDDAAGDDDTLADDAGAADDDTPADDDTLADAGADDDTLADDDTPPPEEPVLQTGCAPGEFAAPELLTVEGTTGDLSGPALSADALTLYFARETQSGKAIWRATRTGRFNVFSDAAPVDELNDGDAGDPLLSADGLKIYFSSDSGLSRRGLFVAERTTTSAAFGNPSALSSLNGSGRQSSPWVAPDDSWITFESDRDGQAALYTAARTTQSAFGSPTKLGGTDTQSDDGTPFITKNILAIYLSSDRPNGVGGRDLWLGTRATDKVDFSGLRNLAVLNSDGDDRDPHVSNDQAELLFSSDRDGASKLYRALAECGNP